MSSRTTESMSSSPFSFVFYLLKVINGNSETLCEICLKLTIKTLVRRHWCCADIFIAIFEQILHIFLMFSLLTLNKWKVAWLRQYFPLFSSCSFKILESTGGTPAWNGGKHHCRLPNETHYPCQEQNIFLLIRTFHGGTWIISYR